MAGLSGICPQRRIIKSMDADSAGEPFLALSFREGPCMRQESMKTDLARQDAEAKQSCALSSQRFARIVFSLAAILLLVTTSLIMGSEIWLGRANDLGRQCTSMHLNRHAEPSSPPRRFAMVTCSDGSNTNPQRSFEGLMDLVTPNKRSYVERHGYDFIDASDVLDRGRPPSWSKILAVSKHLPHYDWVFWNDVVSLFFLVFSSLGATVFIFEKLFGFVDFS